MNGPMGISLGDLQSLMARSGASAQPALNPYQVFQQMRRENPAASSQMQRQASGYSQLGSDYESDFNRLRQEAQRVSRQLLGSNRQDRNYANPRSMKDYAGAAFGGYSPRMAADLGIIGANPSSRYMQDMLPYLDRYNQLRQQYEDRGYRF